jgi:hypothetical protein
MLWPRPFRSLESNKKVVRVAVLSPEVPLLLKITYPPGRARVSG